MCTSAQSKVIKLRIIRISNQSFNQHIKVENAQSGVSRSTGEKPYANHFVNGLLWGGNFGWEELALVRATSSRALFEVTLADAILSRVA